MKQLVIILIVGVNSIFEPVIAQTITRDKIIENSLPYIYYKWNAVAANLWNGKICNHKIVFSAPWVHVGSNVSIPYCWGGFMSLTKFVSLIGMGRSAGDVCSSKGGGCPTEGAGDNCAAGVDCSGLVSIAWEFTTKQSTSTLNNYSKKYASVIAVQKGDILNNPGHHVRLVYKVDPNTRFITVIEASGNGWRTAVHAYRADALTGYEGRYLNNVQ